MSAIVKSVVWLGLVVSAIIGAVALLPNANKYPIPPEFHLSFELIRSYINALNEIMPIDTVFSIIIWSVILMVTTKVVYPLLMWIIKRVTEIKT